MGDVDVVEAEDGDRECINCLSNDRSILVYYCQTVVHAIRLQLCSRPLRSSFYMYVACCFSYCKRRKKWSGETGNEASKAIPSRCLVAEDWPGLFAANGENQSHVVFLLLHVLQLL